MAARGTTAGVTARSSHPSLPSVVKAIRISETMRIGASGYAEAAGLWEPKEARIVVKRDQLASLEAYAGTLLHEAAHAISGTPDVSQEFEDALTAELGGVAERALPARAAR